MEIKIGEFRYMHPGTIEQAKKLIDDGSIYRFKGRLVSYKDGRIEELSTPMIWWKLLSNAAWINEKGKKIDCPKWVASAIQKMNFPSLPAFFIADKKHLTHWDMNNLGKIVVTAEGIYDHFPKNQSKDQPPEEMVFESQEWIKLFAFPQKSFNRHAYSYHLKHVAEAWAHTYICNGAFIKAAMMQGYRVQIKQPNCYFNMNFVEKHI